MTRSAVRDAPSVPYPHSSTRIVRNLLRDRVPRDPPEVTGSVGDDGVGPRACKGKGPASLVWGRARHGSRDVLAASPPAPRRDPPLNGQAASGGASGAVSSVPPSPTGGTGVTAELWGQRDQCASPWPQTDQAVSCTRTFNCCPYVSV